jgi:alkylated DNA nucleotide flippase Atl1
MAKTKKEKTWADKLQPSKDLPKIVPAPEVWGGGKMYIPSPIEVHDVMGLVPKGKIVTISEIREYLAEEHHTDIACPLTTGIFAWISANAAAEEKAKGNKNTIPWWRTLKTGGELNLKFPGGGVTQKELLENEGLEVIPKGKKIIVKDFQKHLAKI